MFEKMMSEYKIAMREKNVIRKEILNYVIAQIKNKKIELQREPDDKEIIQVLKKEIKNRQESISYLEKTWNSEEITIEKAKIAVLQEFLPPMLSEDDLKDIVTKKISELNISDKQKERGKLIWAIMKEYWENVDWSLLNKVINDL